MCSMKKLFLIYFIINSTLCYSQIKIAYIYSQRIINSYSESIQDTEKIDKLNKQIKLIGDKSNCDIIFDTASGIILYAASDVSDLTEYLIDSLNILQTEKRIPDISILSRIAYIQSQKILSSYPEFSNFRKEKSTELDLQKEKELIQPILDQINNQIKNIGEKTNCDLILDTNAGNIIFAAYDIRDITEDLFNSIKQSKKISNFNISKVSNIAYINSQKILCSYSKALEVQDKSKNLDPQQQENMMQPVLARINQEGKKIGEKTKCDLIFDSFGGNILYTNSNIPDLTDLLLKELEDYDKKPKGGCLWGIF